tara:strand:- start:158 stop:619 length:462 start_codon:yes stop_codon:yes gene_type:complete
MAFTIEDVLTELGNRIVEEIKSELRSKDKRATGTLIDNLEAKAVGKELIIKSPGAEKYQSIVDLGRRPGKGVPPDNLRKWIAIKGLRPNRSRNIKTERDLYFVIQRKIKNEGIQGIGYSTASLQKFGPIIGQAVGLKYQEELARIMKQLKAII